MPFKYLGFLSDPAVQGCYEHLTDDYYVICGQNDFPLYTVRLLDY